MTLNLLIRLSVIVCATPLAVSELGAADSSPPKAARSKPEGMVWIAGGEFLMGSDVSAESLCGLPGVTRDSQPVHRVYVDGFWMDKTEVTNEEFEKFVKATGYV